MSDDDAVAPARPGAERKSGPRRKVLLWGLIAAALAAAVAAAGFRYLEQEFDRPASLQNKKTTLFRLKPGMGLRQVAQALASKGLILRPGLFRLQVQIRGGGSRIHAGFYDFSPAMPPRSIYRHITEGRVAQRSFTVPEGFNLREIAAAIEKAGLGKREEILSLAKNADFASSLGSQTASREGYLFPDTYRFPLGISPRRILAKMAGTMKRKFGPALRRRAAERGLTVHQVLTLASVIEKETSVDAERPLVAAVFVNRLRKNMRLQSDPTVIYSLPHFDGNIRRRDLSYDSPYNTYRYKGLPPGPIASPGLASIRAALYPAESDFLYFVATQKGSHKFSRTYREHRQAVIRYQIRKRKVDR